MVALDRLDAQTVVRGAGCISPGRYEWDHLHLVISGDRGEAAESEDADPGIQSALEKARATEGWRHVRRLALFMFTVNREVQMRGQKARASTSGYQRMYKMPEIDLSEDLTKQQLSLRSWILAMKKRGVSEIQVMNDLQDIGLVSSNCVSWRDIADADIAGVISYFRQKKS